MNATSKSKSLFVSRYGATKRDTAKKLRKIATVLEKYGWVQGKFGYKADGPHCLVGAAWYPPDEYIDNTPFLSFLEDYINYRGPFGERGPVNWNDASGRTKEHVIGTLRKAACELDHGWDKDAKWSCATR